MQNITFKLSDLHVHGGAFFEYLALRKTFFVDGLGWDIPHDAIHEMDQYDNPTAWYSLVLRDGKVIGGARCQPTSARWGEHTYMLRDAYEGKLGDIPPDVMIGEISKSCFRRSRLAVAIWSCTLSAPRRSTGSNISAMAVKKEMNSANVFSHEMI